LGFFRRQNLVDQADAQWLFETFAWSLRHFNRDVFFDETVLVVPDNTHFPGRAESVSAMAELIFGHVSRYAGMQHWPLRLQHAETCDLSPPPRLEIPGALRGSRGVAAPSAGKGGAIALGYDARLVANPEALIASFAHALAHYLGQSAGEPPPGGATYWPQATEVLAVFMGFGLMFANSAFQVPVRSCGSCGGPPPQRRSYLTQYDSTYALAIFGVLKDIPDKAVTRHLKKSLRPFFRQCTREIRDKGDLLDRLKTVDDAPGAALRDDVVLSH
jgi:hypothetical protein